MSVPEASSVVSGPAAEATAGTSIPQLTIVDRYGKILGDSWSGNRYVGPKVALAALDKSVKAGATK